MGDCCISSCQRAIIQIECRPVDPAGKNFPRASQGTQHRLMDGHGEQCRTDWITLLDPPRGCYLMFPKQHD